MLSVKTILRARYHTSSSDPYLKNVKHWLHERQLTSILRAPRVPPASNTKNWSRRSDRDKRNCSRISRRRNVVNWIKKLGICLSWSENGNWKGNHLVGGSRWREGRSNRIWSWTLENAGHWNLNSPQRSTSCWRPSSGYFLFELQNVARAPKVAAARPVRLNESTTILISRSCRCKASSTFNMSSQK